MNDSVFEAVEKSSRILRLDFSSIEFAKLAEEQDFSETPNLQISNIPIWVVGDFFLARIGCFCLSLGC